LWLQETPDGDASAWYEKSTTYWHDVPATVGGVLGGFGHLSGVDVKESSEFVRRVVGSLRHATKAPAVAPTVLFKRALDCGAGVGRTAKALLAPMCATVDLLEQDAKFLAKAERDMPPGKAGHFFCQSLQLFEPSEQYQLVWVQWVLNYLTDADLLVFLRRVAAALTPDGVLFVKENMLASERESDCAYDAEDSSVTRSEAGFRAIFAAARLRVVERDVQKQFPAGMLPVRMYALVREPATPEEREETVVEKPS
jgi:protein N-terminal methyltransferase